MLYGREGLVLRCGICIEVPDRMLQRRDRGPRAVALRARAARDNS